ncbi:MAG: hypothetical protein AAF845_12445 [Bacteroidota bacterium]
MWIQVGDVEVNGLPPDLRGQTCEAFLCEQYWCDGALEAPANVSYLRFDGRWHRLYFDCGIVFWREHEGTPESWTVPNEGWDYPVVDVGVEAEVVGFHLAEYRMEPTPGGSRVVFAFENGRNVVLENDADRTGYAIT